MRYLTDIHVPLALTRAVAEIDFKRQMMVSLDCAICQRGRRTVVLFADPVRSCCTPSRHAFPGQIVKLQMADNRDKVADAPYLMVTATYLITYDFQPFVDPKYPQKQMVPQISWARATFRLTCLCGEVTEHETQTNLGRPWKAFCKCGRELYSETEILPQIGPATPDEIQV